MKKYLIALSLMLTLGATIPLIAQTTTKQEEEELLDTMSTDSFDAFSDTTQGQVDSVINLAINTDNDWSNEEGEKFLKSLLIGIDKQDIIDMTFALIIVLVIFVFSPLVIFGLLLYFIFRNRRQKMRLAEMAMRNGQPIPDQLLRESEPDDKATYQNGMRQMFLGVGLMVFLGFTAGKVGFGIGALVFFIGLGKVVIARKPKENPNDLNTHRTNQNNTRDYE